MLKYAYFYAAVLRVLPFRLVCPSVCPSVCPIRVCNSKTNKKAELSLTNPRDACGLRKVCTVYVRAVGLL